MLFTTRYTSKGLDKKAYFDVVDLRANICKTLLFMLSKTFYIFRAILTQAPNTIKMFPLTKIVRDRVHPEILLLDL